MLRPRGAMKETECIVMIESGMSLSHMKTNVTIVSHGRVVTRLGPDCQRCKRYGYPVGWPGMGVLAAAAVAYYGVRFL